jgi:hypothetical protein
LVVIALIAACGKPATSSPPSTVTVTVSATAATPTTTVAPPQPLFRLGDPLTCAKDPPWNHDAPSGSWIEVHVFVWNISRGSQTFVAHDQRLVDVQGREFAPDMREAEKKAEKDSDEVNPGGFTLSVMFFDVPSDTQLSDYRLVLRDSAGVFANVQLKC